MIRFFFLLALSLRLQVPADAQDALPDLLSDVRGRPALDLPAFEQYALTANPTLGQANASVRQSAAQAQQSGLYPNPVIGYQGEQIRGGAYGGGEQGGFVQQTIVLGGKLGLRRNVYEQQRQSNQIAVTAQRFRILADVGRAFYSALAAQEMVNVRQKLAGLARDAVETAHQLANVGQADTPDVLQAEVEEEQASVDYSIAQRTYLARFRTLAALAGKPELPVAPLIGNLETPPSIGDGQTLAQLLTGSPELKRAQQNVAMAEAELKSARHESIPDLQLRAGVQQNFEHLGETTSRAVGLQGFATAGITLPLFNRNQGNVAAANAALDRAKAEVLRVQLALERNAQPMLQSYLSAQLEASRYKTAMLPRALKAYQLYLEKYGQMAAAYPQVLVSQRTYFQLQIRYVEVLEELWATAIALQNYMSSDGLMAPVPSGVIDIPGNLPNANGGAQ